jgi:phosphoribosyl 1,2-cyclic phosphodiesterase
LHASCRTHPLILKHLSRCPCRTAGTLGHPATPSRPRIRGHWSQNIISLFCSGPFQCILEGGAGDFPRVCRYDLSREVAIVKFCVLASGSSGNAALLATENTRILIDAGLSLRELGRRMAAIGEDITRLSAILITHEHSDHVSGLPVMARHKDVQAPMFLTRLTVPAIDFGECTPRVEPFQAGACFQIGDIEVQSFSIPHDAIDPVGFCFAAQGVRIGIATDLGYIPESIKFHLRRTDLLLLEANHDLDMLKVGPYPWSVKQRVMSRVGHLSNLVMSDYLLEDLSTTTAHLVLGHISELNNHPEIVRIIAQQALEQRGLDTRLAIAEQRRPSEVFQF